MTAKVIIGCIFLSVLGNSCSKESGYEGYEHYNDVSNLTIEEDDDPGASTSLMRPQRFTAGTLLGLLVASMVVVIGSFLVLWRVCCEVEMVVTREAMEPLTSVSQNVEGSLEAPKKRPGRLIGHGCTSSVLQIA